MSKSPENEGLQVLSPIVKTSKPVIGEEQCFHCTALCCRYVNIEIEPPEDEVDLDNMRWYLIHDKVSILVDEKTWMVKFDTDCQYLGADHSCGIYHTRPQACQDFEVDSCDYMTWKLGYPTSYREFKDFKRLKDFVENYWWQRETDDEAESE